MRAASLYKAHHHPCGAFLAFICFFCLQRIKEEERWENKVILRKDAEGVEKLIKSELVGAEELRTRYEELLQAKSEMMG